MTEWTFVTDDDVDTDAFDSLVQLIQTSSAAVTSLTGIVDDDGKPSWTASVARLHGDRAVGIWVDHRDGQIIWAHAHVENCDAPTGWHDDGDLMLCTLPPGHGPDTEHSHHGSGEYLPRAEVPTDFVVTNPEQDDSGRPRLDTVFTAMRLVEGTDNYKDVCDWLLRLGLDVSHNGAGSVFIQPAEGDPSTALPGWYVVCIGDRLHGVLAPAVFAEGFTRKAGA